MRYNLEPYQFQIGDLVFGRKTMYPVEAVDIQTYNVNAADFQVVRSDETRMGIDTFAAGPIIFNIGVIDNYPMPSVPGSGSLPVDLASKHSTLLTKLQKEWKAEEIKGVWGALKPLRICGSDGMTKRIYGRPRKFTYTRKTPKSNFWRVTAEYQRSDTKAYDDIETLLELDNGAAAIPVTRTEGDADAWMRILLTGPQTHPLITMGNMVIDFDHVIPPGGLVEISSYPWSRRVVDNAGINWRTKLVGDTKYLDQIKFVPNLSTPFEWAATGTDANSKCQILWRDAYHVIG